MCKGCPTGEPGPQGPAGIPDNTAVKLIKQQMKMLEEGIEYSKKMLDYYQAALTERENDIQQKRIELIELEFGLKVLTEEV